VRPQLFVEFVDLTLRVTGNKGGKEGEKRGRLIGEKRKNDKGRNNVFRFGRYVAKDVCLESSQHMRPQLFVEFVDLTLRVTKNKEGKEG
jgi:hypothetical protein